MKELSIEEKAKRYDEAIAHAKMLLKTIGNATLGNLVLKNEFKNMFPELKESDDEMIRKALIHYMKDYSDGTGLIHAAYGVSRNDAIAWLEKQGEHKPADKIQLGKKYKCIASPRYSTFMIGEIYKPEDKFLCSLMNFCYDCFEPIEDGEQKPAWSEEDDDNLSWLVEMLLGFDGNDIECYKDKKFIDKCKEVCKWLKAIKDRTFPQPKQEWSEEDEKYLIYNIEQDYRDKLNNNPSESLRPYYNKVISWLKSIRHQKQWKPSEEQIIDLEKAIDDFIPSSYKEIRVSLEKLLKQLKTL